MINAGMEERQNGGNAENAATEKFAVRLSAYGGSYPPGFQGLQRQMRQMPRNAPRIAPCFRTDSMNTRCNSDRTGIAAPAVG